MKHLLPILLLAPCSIGAAAADSREPSVSHELPTPPEIWSAYDPDAGDYKEEILREETHDGIHHRESYISAYVLGEEVRVFCKYSVEEGATNAPGLMDVQSWMGAPNISKDYVNEGWAADAIFASQSRIAVSNADSSGKSAK